MEITLEAVISLVGLFIGGSGGAFFMWKWQQRKAKAEAETAEVDTVRNMQEAYDRMFTQVNHYLEDASAKVEGIRQERDHYKGERDDLRDKVEKLTRSFMDWRLEADNDRSKMKLDIARLGRKVECMRPLLCGRENCAIRLPVELSPAEVAEEKREAHDIEPYDDRPDS